MSRTIYSDESGTSNSDPCYSIGALIIPSDCRAEFERTAKRMKGEHGVTGEVKWTKVSTSHGLINFGLDIFKHILSVPYFYDVIVVNKQKYNNWTNFPQEKAFYQTYTLLAKHIAKNLGEPIDIEMDSRSDTYPKQDEVIMIIGNYMLRQIQSAGSLQKVRQADSKLEIGVQVADILTGAINAANSIYLVPDLQIHPGKLLLLERMSAIIGWDGLHYDTYPKLRFNIWKFPIESRARPRSRNRIAINLDVPFVSAEELEEYICSV